MHRLMYRGSCALLVLGLSTWDGRARADDDETKNATIVVEVEGELQLERQFVKNGSDRTALGAEVETGLTVRPTAGISFNGRLVYEELEDEEEEEDGGDSAILENHGLFAEELYAALEGDAFTLKLGKFNPVFGTAFEAAPGIWGDELAEDTYELTEQVGVGLTLAGLPTLIARDDEAEAQIDVALVTADRSVLGRALINDRDRLRKQDGGAGNTGTPRTLVLAWTERVEEEDEDEPKWGWSLAFRARPGGRGDPGDELGLVLGTDYALWNSERELGHKIFAGGAALRDFEASRDDAAVFSAGVELEKWGWFGTVAGGFRQIRSQDERDQEDAFLQLSIGRQVFDGLFLEAGWLVAEEENENSHTIGLRLSFEWGYAR